MKLASLLPKEIKKALANIAMDAEVKRLVRRLKPRRRTARRKQ